MSSSSSSSWRTRTMPMPMPMPMPMGSATTTATAAAKSRGSTFSFREEEEEEEEDEYDDEEEEEEEESEAETENEEEEDEDEEGVGDERDDDPEETGADAADHDKWIDLQNHPLFLNFLRRHHHHHHHKDKEKEKKEKESNTKKAIAHATTSSSTNLNYMTWHEASQHLYLWDPYNRSVYCLSLRFSTTPNQSSSSSSPANANAIQAAYKFKTYRPNGVKKSFNVHNISLNKTGNLLCLVGAAKLFIAYLHQQIGTPSSSSSTDHSSLIFCRTASVGSQIYTDRSDFIQILQVSWHPYSTAHLGVLSSDSLLRVFDLSRSLERPEQEFYLQPNQHGHSATSMRLVGFSFGFGHLWERFAVFVMFSDGSIYVLCPVVPFRSVHKCAAILELYKDAQCGLKLASSLASFNAGLAINWLVSTFPELADISANQTSLLAVKALPYALADASLSLQGPLCRLSPNMEKSDGYSTSYGRALAFLYNSAPKDTILTTAWSSGLLDIHTLADEVQPVWSIGTTPSVFVDASEIVRIAMICESGMEKLMSTNLSQSAQSISSDWMGYPPPLLRLGILDLSLKPCVLDGYSLLLFPDPLFPQRIYCVHGAGVDSIGLHQLPFSDQSSGNGKISDTTSIAPVLQTMIDDSTPSPLHGFVALSDAFGESWIISLTSSHECLLRKMAGFDLLEPVFVELGKMKLIFNEDPSELKHPGIFNNDLLLGPKDLGIPRDWASLRSLSADSIEGRSALNHFFNLFHETYVQYANKVFLQLKAHVNDLKKKTDNQLRGLQDANQKLARIEEDHSLFKDKLCSAFEINRRLESRLKRVKSLPGIKERPLSAAERDFKSELEDLASTELHALRSSIEALSGRFKRHLQSQSMGTLHQQAPGKGSSTSNPESQSLQLKISIERLASINNENSEKVKLIEAEIKDRERRREQKNMSISALA